MRKGKYQTFSENHGKKLKIWKSLCHKREKSITKIVLYCFLSYICTLQYTDAQTGFVSTPEKIK